MASLMIADEEKDEMIIKRFKNVVCIKTIKRLT